MDDKSKKRYMELQMEELQETYGHQKEEQAEPKSTSGDPKDAEIAELYEDAWEYEQELEILEAEFEIIKSKEIKDIPSSLNEKLPNDQRDYEKELKAVIEAGWISGENHTEEQLELIKKTEFTALATALSGTYPDSGIHFEEELKDVLFQSWETLIKLKKDHIKEETDYIKALGLKSHYAKKIYKRYHGID